MSRGPIPKRAIEAALAVARTRGIASRCQRGSESVCDIVIHAQCVTIDAMIRRCRRLHAPPAELERQFEDTVAKLRLLPDNPCRSRELWTCSPRGVFRFFRVLNNCLAEIDFAGKCLPGGPA